MPDAIAPAAINEAPRAGELPRPHAERLAREKAEAVADATMATLAADTVVAVGRRILPKADIEAQAAACLHLLSGRAHQVITAVVLITADGARSARTSVSRVSFARLEPRDFDAYLATGEWRGCAGGYAIQGRAAGFVRALSGSYSGVVGLPLFETAQLLRGRGLWRP